MSEDNVESRTLINEAGFEVTINPIGAALESIIVPTASSRVDVLLGYPSSDEYASDPYFMGKTIGRFANRIRNARIEIDGVEFNLDANEHDTGHCLHGGGQGLYRKRWSLLSDPENRRITCKHMSPDGASGFPGNVEITVFYQLVGEATVLVEFLASSDAETVLSLANHAYFNLGGRRSSIDSHEIMVHAARYTPIDSAEIPTGEICEVRNSTFDLRCAQELGKRRFDINYVMDNEIGELRLAAEVYSPDSGIRLKVHTTQPGLQLYTGDNLGAPFAPRQGLCLEAQNFPDAPNQPGFPSARLYPGMSYRHQTVYEFSTVTD